MKVIRTPAATIILLAVFVVTGASLARAGQLNCTYGGGSGTCFTGAADWGTLQAPNASGTLPNGSYNEQTYLNGSGVWTYVFEFTASVSGVSALSTGLGSLGSETDTFDSGLSFGGISDLSTGGGALTFNFGTGLPSTFSLSLGFVLRQGEMIEFYGQSPFGPAPGTFSSLDGGAYNGPAVDPSPTPESSSGVLFLMGTVLLAGVLIAQKHMSA